MRLLLRPVSSGNCILLMQQPYETSRKIFLKVHLNKVKCGQIILDGHDTLKCKLCEDFNFTRQDVAERHVIEQHSGFAWKCRSCKKIWSWKCAHNDRLCVNRDLILFERATGISGENTEVSFEKYKKETLPTLITGLEGNSVLQSFTVKERASVSEPASKRVRSASPVEDRHPGKPVRSASPVEDRHPGKPVRSASPVEDRHPGKPVSSASPVEDRHPGKPVRSASPVEDRHPGKPVRSASPVEDRHPEKRVRSTSPVEDRHPGKPVRSTSPVEDRHPGKRVRSTSPVEDRHPGKRVRSTSPVEDRHSEKPVRSTSAVEDRHPEKPVRSMSPVEDRHPGKRVRSASSVEDCHPEKQVRSTSPVEDRHPGKQARSTSPVEDCHPGKRVRSTSPVEDRHPGKHVRSTSPVEECHPSSRVRSQSPPTSRVRSQSRSKDCQSLERSRSCVSSHTEQDAKETPVNSGEDVLQLIVRHHQIEEQRMVLDIGGTKFTTSRLTLQNFPDSLLAILSSTPKNNKPRDSIFSDRDPAHFRHILNYYRNEGCFSSLLPRDYRFLKELALEAAYYRLPGLLETVNGKLSMFVQEKVEI
ncbi:serine/arginine repetitive matrix protein 2-like [Gigantopelta aegis]|uniref:serine/arginine repetitive matrix protein 2-like n=1 Tax=Gigantopelta aegis TaxID=1735272 RepID=UPI001B887AD9|nr:serine/arginine repetitive matrix protein 2-like [Gigantopelta aegis]